MSRLTDRTFASVALLAPVLLGLVALTSCGGGSSSTGFSTGQTGSVTTTVTDPPSCKAPKGDFMNVWVTITKVRAHISSDAGPNDSGWVTLVDLTSSPKQIDLLSLQSTTCLLTQLGSTSGLAAGSYQQIRVLLLDNSPASGMATPSPNNCGSSGFNCVVLADGIVVTLQLSSESQTGIKIPSGQIAGGSFKITAGQSTDLNIDFNTCSSIVVQGRGQFRLKPVLRAGEVSLSQNSIGGVVVDSSASPPKAIAGANVQLEQPDSNAIDRVISATQTGSDGSFSFCPVPAGNYDVVADAQTTSGMTTTTYSPTITFTVAVGSAMGNVPLVPEGVTAGTGTLTGNVTTATTGGAATPAAVALWALQDVTPVGGSLVHVTVPVLSTSTSSVLTTSSASCASAAADCAAFTLVVPNSNPQFATFNGSSTTYPPPVVGPVNFTVNGEAFSTTDSSQPDCSPSSLTSSAVTLLGSPATATVNLPFSGCS